MPPLSRFGLRVPREVIQSKRVHYLRHGQPIHRPELLHDAPFSMVAQYQQGYRGIVAYCRLAFKLHQLNRLKWVRERSLVQTLAHKLRVSASAVYRRYQSTIPTDRGPLAWDSRSRLRGRRESNHR
jgi:hypothetical protein